ncbi:hypothetical protein ACFL5Z_07515 [Planctomycetota bacterium]
MNRSAIRAFTFLMTLPAVLLLFGFADTEPRQQKVLTAEMPLYLEEHLDAAHIVGSEVPADAQKVVEWRFDVPQPDWKPLKPIPVEAEAVKPVRAEDAIRLPLTAKNRINKARRLFGAIYVGLPDWNIDDWAYVEIRARTRDPIGFVSLGFNYTKEDPHRPWPRYSRGNDWSSTVVDGTIQTYRLSLGTRSRNWQGPWTHLMIICTSDTNVEAATFDILSVRVVPKEASYADAPVGVRSEVRDNMHWRTIFVHTPGKLEYRLHTPQAARLDIGLGVLKENTPVAFRITAKQDGGDSITILEETYADHKHWAQRCVDLSDFSGKMITLSLEVDAKRAGTVAFWAEPTVSGRTGMGRLRTGTLIWDTQSPFVDEVDLRDRTNWRVVVDPPIGWSPATYGKGYFFKGDAVVENEKLAAVFCSGKGRVVIYSKADSSQKKVEFVPLQLKQGPASITNCRILQNTGDEATLEVSFTGAETEEKLSTIFSFSKNEIIEIKPAENMKGISLLGPIEYGIAPDFIADDLIFDPTEYPSTSTLPILSSNLFLGLLKGQNSMLVVTWPQGEQQMRLMLGNRQEEPRLIECVDFENDGKSIYLALLEAPGIWHKEKLKPTYLEKDITINWKKPFPAKWITQLSEGGVRTTYRFRGSRGRNARAGIGGYIYPVWFEGENTLYRLGKKIPPKGESLIYSLERKGTPVSVSAPVDVMKETLGGQACDTILDLPGRVLRTHHRRPGETFSRACTCGFTEDVLEEIFKEGQEVEKKELIEETVDDMVFFITQHAERINEYQDFAHDMTAFLNLKKKSNPDLRPFLDAMETITQEIIQAYSSRKEHLKTLDYVDELARKTKALTQKKDPQNLPTFLDLGEKWRGIGGAQDDLLGEFHRTTRNLFQEAGYRCINHPEAMEIAKEIRSRCRECLRNPDGYEIWPDY